MDLGTGDHIADLPSRVRSHRLSLARRLRDHVVNKTSDLADAPLRIDPEIYTSEARFAAERQKVFRETPLAVCLSTDIEAPGQFITSDDTGVPIIVARGKDGEVRAFLNICPHRGARLVRTTSGRSSRFTCWFHGWTFLNDGKLLAAPSPKSFGEELGDCSHLTPLPVAERNGFVFVVATPGVALDIDAFLGTFAEQIDLLEIGDMVPVKSVDMHVKSNWKFVLDTFYEGYHLASMHTKTLMPSYRHDIHIYDHYGPHFRFLNVARDLEKMLLEVDEQAWQLDHRFTGSSFLFPNTYIIAGVRPALSDSPGGHFYAVFHLYPGEQVGQTKVCLNLYGPREETGPAYLAQIDANCAAMVGLLTSEDFTMAEEAWRGLAVIPKGQKFVVGREEKLVQSLELSIAERVGMPLVAQSEVAAE